MLAVLQARMSSRRLPGKVLKPLLGTPMILRQVERLRRSARLRDILVATSVDPSDDALAEVCRKAGLAVFRGPLEDVLGRFAAALAFAGSPENFLRLTADCPLADPEVIDGCIALHLSSQADYTANWRGRTYPKGLDVEVCRLTALEAAAREAEDPYEREHVTPFIHRRGERFRLVELRRDPPLRFRWTVDEPEDFLFVEAVYADLYPKNPAFSSEDVVDWQDANPGRALPNLETS